MNIETPKQTTYSLEDLLYLMTRLRDPEYGCPWDIQQTFKSITPSTIEEAYEVVDAIEREDDDHIKEELGDLLFQVIFYSEMAREKKSFAFNDVVHGLVDKLIRRHPHVFPDGDLTSRRARPELSPEEVKGQWEAIKQQERANKGKHSLLDDVPIALPALTRAQKLQKRASSVGFDWKRPDEVIEKLEEELDELKVAMRSQSKDQVLAEAGDMLFTVVNLIRHLKGNAENVLADSNRKFVQRFEYVESQTGLSECDPTAPNSAKPSSETLELAWAEAKKQGL